MPRSVAARAGAGAAASMLPAALAGALLVGAPYVESSAGQRHERAAAETRASAVAGDDDTRMWVVLGAAELLFVGVGLGVVRAARRVRAD